LNFQVEPGQLCLTIADNGQGLPPGARTEEMSGVANMRGRIEKLNGHFEMTSQAGHGTIVRFSVPSL